MGPERTRRPAAPLASEIGVPWGPETLGALKIIKRLPGAWGVGRVDFQLLAQALVNGLTLTSFIVLMTLGLMIIFGVLQIINFAHGQFFMLGAFTVFFGVDNGLSLWLMLPLAFVGVGLLGAGLSHGIFRRFQGNLLGGAIAAVALSSLLQNSAFQVFTAEPRAVFRPIDHVFRVGGIALEGYRVFVVSVTIVILVALFLFLHRTWQGRAIRAVQQNPYAAQLQGVNMNLTSALGFAVGAGLAGLAGAVMVPLVELSPGMGFTPLLWGFVVVILGGMGRVGGVLLAGLIIGMQQSFTATYWRPELTILMSFALVVVVLLLRRSARPGAVA